MKTLSNSSLKSVFGGFLLPNNIQDHAGATTVKIFKIDLSHPAYIYKATRGLF